MSTESKKADSASPSSAADGPIVVDLGRRGRKAIKKLRKGDGKLMDEAEACVQELKDSGAVPASAVPIIIIVREKRKTPKLFPFSLPKF